MGMNGAICTLCESVLYPANDKLLYVISLYLTLVCYFSAILICWVLQLISSNYNRWVLFKGLEFTIYRFKVNEEQEIALSHFIKHFEDILLKTFY